jgi:uridine phosphorylase
MKYNSVKLTQRNGTMYHLGVKEDQIAKKVILIPDPQQVPFYAAFLDKAEKMGEHREYVTYTGTFCGQPLTIMSCGFGCMPIAIAVEELNHLGVEEIIKIDCCPAMGQDLKPGDLTIAAGAVRGEYASREYIDVSYPAVPHMELMNRLFKEGLRSTVLFRSHDVRSLETPATQRGREQIAYWADLGVEVQDGETSSLFVIASVLQVKAASLALIAENYTTGEKAEPTLEAQKALFHTAACALTAI